MRRRNQARGLPSAVLEPKIQTRAVPPSCKEESSPAGNVAGLATTAQQIDLIDISFASASLLGYTGNVLSGVVSVGDGTHTALLTLIGNYSIASFHLANDGGGGTMLTDPPIPPPGGQGALLHSAG